MAGPIGKLRSAVRGWGTTPEELAAPLPCDELMPEGKVADRAIDVGASAATTFRWLCQLRVAPYSYDWIDNFGRRSPRELTPGLDDLEPGQRFMTIFRLESFVPDEHITLTTKRVAVTYRVTPGADGTSRLHMRLRWRGLPPGLAFGDLIMARKQLMTLSELASRARPASGAARPPRGSRAPSARNRA